MVECRSAPNLAETPDAQYNIVLGEKRCCTPSTVWQSLTLSTPPGRVNYAVTRDPGRRYRPRNPRRKGDRWYRHTWHYRDRTQFGS